MTDYRAAGVDLEAAEEAVDRIRSLVASTARPEVVGGIGGFGGFFAFVGFLTFFAALEKGSASTVVTLSALYPVVTILISTTLLHEKLTTRQGFGIVLALIASALLAS